MAIVLAAAACGGGGGVAASLTTAEGGIQAITLSATSVQVAIGSTAQITAAVVASGSISRALTWSSSNQSVVTVTASNGVATVVGVSPGVAQVVAKSVADTTKTASASVTVVGADPCALKPYTLGTTINGSITSASCDGAVDHYTYVSTTQQFFYVCESSTSLANYLGPLIYDLRGSWSFVGGSGSLCGYVLARPGTYQLETGTGDKTKLGPYTLATTVNATVFGTCTGTTWVTRGVSATLTLPSTWTSCWGWKPVTLPPGVYPAASLVIDVYAGQNLGVHVISSDFTPVLEIIGPNGLAGSDSPTSGTTANVAIAARQDPRTAYEIQLISRSGRGGAYTITIDP